jgi:ribose transport system ATP-binding protein
MDPSRATTTDAITTQPPNSHDSRSIRICRLSKTFPGQQALAGLDLVIPQDEVHCLLGQNGSGKSTLIKILSGYHTFDDGGEITVHGEQLRGGHPSESARHGLRFVHQQTGVINDLTAVENLSLGAGFSRKRTGRIDWHRQRKRARELLAYVGRPDQDLDRPMRYARAVDRTALAIARALDPHNGEIRFLFLDEPTAALPVAEVDHLIGVVQEVRSRGVGVVYVTHRLDEVFRLGDRVTILRDGRNIGTHDVPSMTTRQLIDLIVGEGPSRTEATRSDVRPRRTNRVRARSEPHPRLAVRELDAELLSGVSFEARAGEVLGFAGLDGSGREQLCYALLGAIPSTATQISLDGAAIAAPLTPRRAAEHGIALAPGNRQPGCAVAKFSLRENLTLPQLGRYRRRLRIDTRNEDVSATGWIERLNIRTSQCDSPSRALFSQLSGGNQQKVVIAKWLATKPRVLLLDEPTAGVDVGARTSIYEVIRTEAERGTSIVVTSSDVQDFIQVCERVLVLAGGRLIASFTGDEIAEAAILDALTTEGSVRRG